MEHLVLIPAAAVGLALAYADTRPGWDDTGVMAVAVVAAGVLFGALSPRRPWLTALAVGAWIPAWHIARSYNYGSLLALMLAFAGAYAGMAARRVLATA